ncbi:MAG: antibiotic biosynthesis monooxygenase family protein [Dehalococcoidia bacterium]
MFAKVVTIEGPPETVDEGMEGFRDRNLPVMKKAPGWQGAYLLIDRATGKGMAITLWDSEEEADASERIAARFREVSARERGGGSTPKVERFEVAVQELKP